MRKGFFGLREIMVAILATVILLIIAYLLIRMANPAAAGAINFGEQTAGVLK